MPGVARADMAHSRSCHGLCFLAAPEAGVTIQGCFMLAQTAGTIAISSHNRTPTARVLTINNKIAITIFIVRVSIKAPGVLQTARSP